MLADIVPEIHPLTNSYLLPRIVQKLKCPSCGKSNFTIYRDESTAWDIQTHCVVVCDECKTCFKYDSGILEMLIEKPTGLSLAQKSNFMSIIASHYQSGWRSWCMTIFCGKKCSNAMEAERITQMVELSNLPENPVLVDLGTSHGFYAIAIAKKLKEANSSGFVIAIDFSRKMLHQAVRAAERNSVSEKIIWLLADVEDMPLTDSSADRVSCGGSLNEYRHPEKAIRESARILGNGGIYVTMNLFRKNALTGLLQAVIHWSSGLSFFARAYWNNLFSGSGFQVLQQEICGIVMFTKSKK